MAFVGGYIDQAVIINTLGQASFQGRPLAGLGVVNVVPNVANALNVSNGTTTILSLDTRNTVTGVTTLLLTPPPPTIAGAAGTTYSAAGIAAFTFTTSTQTLITALRGLGLSIGVVTINQSGGAVTISQVSGLDVSAPTPGGSVTLTATYAASFRGNGGPSIILDDNASRTVVLGSGGGGAVLPGGNPGVGTTYNAAFYIVSNSAAIVGVSGATAAANDKAVNITPANQTIAGVAGSTYSGLLVTTFTWTTSTQTGITAMNGMSANFAAPTLNQSGGAVVITTASTVYISGKVTAGGSVTITNNFALDVASDIYAETGIFLGGVSTNNKFSAASAGVGTTNMFIGNAQITVASDMRLKRDIQPTSRNALETFGKLKVVDYTWADPSRAEDPTLASRGRFTGMLAQDMVDVVPWIINAPDRTCVTCRAGQPCDRHDSYWFVEYEHLVPLLVKGFQEAQAVLDRHEARLTAIEADGWLKDKVRAGLAGDAGFKTWLKQELVG